MVTLADIQSTLRNIETLLREQKAQKAEPKAEASAKVPTVAREGDYRGIRRTPEVIANQLAHWVVTYYYFRTGSLALIPQAFAYREQDKESGAFDVLELRFHDFPRIAQTAEVLSQFFSSRSSWLVKLQPDLRNHQTAVALTDEDKGIHFVVEGPGPGYLVRIRAAGR